jgi:hypothetical protein
MNAKENQLSNKNSNGKVGRGGWWMGAALIISSALSISVVLTNAPPKTASEPPSRAQSVPVANVLSARAYQNLYHPDPSNRPLLVPDANVLSARAYQNLYHPDPSNRPLPVPEANVLSARAYQNLYHPDPSNRPLPELDADT